MADLKTKKSKHLTLDDRIEIQGCLDHGMAFKAIAGRIGKDPTTVSKEVKKHFTVKELPYNRTDMSGRPIRTVCPSLMKVPFVCNPCERRHRNCSFQKRFYNAKEAQRAYETLLSEAREGVPLNKAEFYEIDRIVSNGIKRGQHLYHIMQSNQLGVSKSTLYRHLKRGYLSVKPLDFPRVVKFKARRAKREDYVPKAARIDRSYDCFLSYIEERGILEWVEMDTVIGRIGGKAILTLHFTLGNFMAGILLENKTASEVTEKLIRLKTDFAAHNVRFGDIFPLILTDNGGEFANVAAIENSLSGDKETSLFFCDPYKSCQKPRIEKNHTLFRDIVPKGESFDGFSQSTVNTIFSHVNSVMRGGMKGKTPFEVFTFAYDDITAKILGIEAIPAQDVIQSPKLLKV